MQKYKYVIIGAGPTGLGAAYRLKELGQGDFIVLDALDEVGGLASSFVDEKGFTWDIGGHVQFSHYAYFDSLMEKALGDDGWLHHQRESWVWIAGRFVPYPFQNNIRYLPREMLWKCLSGLIELYRTPAAKPGNFKEWILGTFGEGIAETFLLPYNFKVWAYPPETMQHSWVGERVAVTDLQRVTENILFAKDDLSWGPNNTFQFPRFGGTGAIWRGVADLVGRDKIQLSTRVTSIDVRNHTLKTAGGESLEYNALISTMPLDALTPLLSEHAAELTALSSRLRRSSSNIVGIGLRGRPSTELSTKCWMYFPENDCPFYRVTLFSKYSPNNVPDITKHWSLMAEVSESDHKPVVHESLVEDVIEGMLRTKLIASRDDVISTWRYRAGHGYPTPSLERDKVLNVLLPKLDSLDIYSRGRFGAWKYEVSNQDHSLMQGVEVVNRLELGVPEITLRYPNTANANWGRY